MTEQQKQECRDRANKWWNEHPEAKEKAGRISKEWAEQNKDILGISQKKWWANHPDFKPRLGDKMSDATKEKMRIAKLGKKRKPFTQEHKDKLKEILNKVRVLAVEKIKVPDRFCIDCGKKIDKYIKNERCADCSRKYTKQYRIDNGLNKTNPYSLIRGSKEYKLWREQVFSRDNYTCQKTGKKGGELHPHHILNFNTNAELRFDVDNGITLSLESHREFHHLYGVKNNTREQIEEYIKRV